MLPGSSFSTGCWSLSSGIPSSRRPSLTMFPCRAERACDPPPGCPRPGWGPRPAARHGFATATGLLLSLCGGGGGPSPGGISSNPPQQGAPRLTRRVWWPVPGPWPWCALAVLWPDGTRVKSERSRRGPAAQSSGGDGCSSGVGAGAPTRPSPGLQACASPAGDCGLYLCAHLQPSPVAPQTPVAVEDDTLLVPRR